MGRTGSRTANFVPGAFSSRGWWRDVLCVSLLAALAAWLFRFHLLGDFTFLGNPDRLNNYLKILEFHVDSLAAGGLMAWNDAELLGYDTLAHPGMFPGADTYFMYLFGADNVYIVAGFLSALLLALSGITTYVFVRNVTGDRWCSLIGAILYAFSEIAILKVSQANTSFSVIALLPLLALVVRRASAVNMPSTFALSSVLIFFLLQFTFLQKAAYVLIFAGAYALYRAWEQRDWRPFAVLFGGFLVGLVGALPRLYGLAVLMMGYVRIQPGEKMESHSDLFQYQGIMPDQILRWFDGGIFGRFLSDETAISNGLNLTEGFLLYTSSMVPFLMILAMVRRQDQWSGSLIGPLNEIRFFLWFMLFTFCVALFKPVNYLFYLAFLKVDFVHARFLMAGLLPLVVYIALFLTKLAPKFDPTSSPGGRRIAYVISIPLAVAIVSVIELLANAVEGNWKQSWGLEKNLSLSALARIALSGVAIIALIAALRRSSHNPTRALVFQLTLGVSLCVQTIVAADFHLNGDHTRKVDIPFRGGDIYFSSRSEFRPPSPDLKKSLHERVERDKYRSVVVCDQRTAGGFCAAHIGQYWQLRLADGYYGLGVPRRLAMLPWPNGLGLRHVVFTSVESLPWELLGLLNVKYALVADPVLYGNRSPTMGRASLEERVRSIQIVENPDPVMPRVFLTRAVVPATTSPQALALLLQGNPSPNLLVSSIVEGIDSPRHFTTEGRLYYAAKGDTFEVTLEPSRHERFLVVNELFTPRWKAKVDGHSAPIYPTNVVMRGVIIPAGARKMEMTYVPTVKNWASMWFYGGGIVLLILVTALLAHFARPAGRAMKVCGSR